MSFFKTTATASRKEEGGDDDRGRKRVEGPGARNSSHRVGSASAKEARKANGIGDKGGGDGRQRGARGRGEQEASTDLFEEDDDEMTDDQIKDASLEELEELERTLEDDYIPQPSAIVHSTSNFTGLNNSTAPAYPPGLGITFDASPTSPQDTCADEESDGTEEDTDDDVEVEIAYVTKGEEHLYTVAPYRRYRVKRYSRLRISWKPIPR